MRKPSFLEINDNEEDFGVLGTRLVKNAPTPPGSGSFLNLRDSFDTVRDEDGP
jgi:hypothetical protein